MDIIYLIDASTGVTKDSLEIMKGFIAQQGVINSISSNGVRMSLISYGDSPTTLLSLSRGIDIPLLRTALENLVPVGGKRNIDKALERVKDIIENKRDGSRANSGKVVIAFLDGKIDPALINNVKNKLNDLNKLGVKLAVIGMGPDLKKADVESLVTGDAQSLALPSSKNIFDATPLISSLISKSVQLPFKLDVGFIIGARGPTAATDFALGKQMILSILRKLDVGPDQNQVGLILYGVDVGILLRLNTAQNRDDAIRLVERLRVPRVGSTLAQAIDLARDDLFNVRYEARKNIPKLALIFYNHVVDSRAQNAAQKLVADGVNIVYVALGENVNFDSVRSMKRYQVKGNEDTTSTSNAIISFIKPGKKRAKNFNQMVLFCIFAQSILKIFANNELLNISAFFVKKNPLGKKYRVLKGTFLCYKPL